MKKVFQTRISKNNGNCAQAVVASLFDLELDDVPDFVSKHSIRPMNVEIVKFHNERGFKAGYINKHNNLGIRNKSLLEIAKSDVCFETIIVLFNSRNVIEASSGQV